MSFFFNLISFYFLTLQYCIGFAIYQHESATGIHVFPILNPPPSLPVSSLWVVSVHQPQASSIVHRTWTGDSFHIWYYKCFNAILPNHPTDDLPLPQSPKDCSIHQCLFCCLVWHPTPVLLPGKSHGQRSLESCSPWGRWGSDITERLHFHFSLSCIGERNGNPLQCSCLENPRDGGAWWASVYGVAQSRTWLKWLSRSIQGYCYHLSKFHIYALVYCIGVFLSGLLHTV